MVLECCMLSHCRSMAYFLRPLHFGLNFKMKTAVLIFIIGVFNIKVQCFNVDLRTKSIYSKEHGSMFGYSVAQHQDQGVAWLLVGAPNAQTTQSGVTNGGAVYRCRIDSINTCEYIEFDPHGNNIQQGTFEKIEEKSNQWFGATLSSSGPDGVVVACAPRYVYFSRLLNKREPVGACFTATEHMRRMTFYSPCRVGVDRYPTLDNYHKQDKCQAGISVIMPPTGDWLVMGAPGSWYWQGQLFSKNLNSNLDADFTGEGPGSEDDSYLGYSVATGDFTGDGIPDYVAGAPKDGHSIGKILLWTRALRNLQNITGYQMGANFGHSLAVTDLNRDGFDDIIVGAPYYTDYSTTLIETGRVYVFYQNENHLFSKDRVDILEGENKISGARFGSSLATLDDMNQDGIKDLAVGAPYDGLEGRGAVYVFHGSDNGVNPNASQIIYGKDVDDTILTFGYSVAGGYDLDENKYPDILVGAYKSDKAIFLRSRPIVTVTVDINITPKYVNLNVKDCLLQDGTNGTCMNINTCFSYRAIDTPNEINMEIGWLLDSEQPLNRRVFLKNPSQKLEKLQVQVEKGVNKCYTHNAYVKDGIRDKLSPIVVDFSFKLLIDESQYAPDELIPILNQNKPQTVKAEGEIWKNCGIDNICIPDLRVSARSLSRVHKLGSTDSLTLAITVENLKQGAYESLLTIILPPGVKYTNIYNVESPIRVSCAKFSIEADNFVSCEVGNPLPENGVVKFNLRMKPEDVNGTSEYLRFMLHVNSSNAEMSTATSNNHKDVDIPVEIVSAMKLSGVSDPEQLVYSSNESVAVVAESDIGPQVIHLYEVRNDGPSSIKSISVNILWPSTSEGDSGDHLLYLPEGAKVTQGNGHCETKNVNPENVTVGNIDVVTVVPLTTDGKLRRRRDVTNTKDGTKMDCSKDWCSNIICTLYDMKQGDNALIQIRSRVWRQNLIKAGYRDIVLQSVAAAEVTEFPYEIQPRKYPKETFQIDTLLHSDSIPESQPLQWWWILIAVAAGVILLIILVVVLWKCGFFLRKRVPEETEEDEPLNKVQRTNGTNPDEV